MVGQEVFDILEGMSHQVPGNNLFTEKCPTLGGQKAYEKVLCNMRKVEGSNNLTEE